MSLYPWNKLDPNSSPFVLVFAQIGLPAAATIINFVVITAAASSCNSGMFGSSRMLYSMISEGEAPKFLGHLNKRQVPIRCLNLSVLMMLIGVLLNYLVPGKIFGYAIAAVLAFLLWTCGAILVSHLGYRRAVRNGSKKAVAFQLPGAPATTWIALGFIAFIVVLMAFQPEMRIALYAAEAWFALLIAIYVWRKPKIPLAITTR